MKDLSDISGTGYRPHDAVYPTDVLRNGRVPDGLNDTGLALLEEIAAGDATSLDELATLLEIRYGRPRKAALADVAAFVQRAQMNGLVSFQRAPGSLGFGPRLALNLLLMPIRGGVLLPSVQRTYYPFTLGRMVASTASAQLRLGLLVLLVVLVPLSLMDGFWSLAGSHFLAGLGVGLIGGLLILGIAHEAAHALTSQALGLAPRAVYRQGLRVGLHRGRLGPGRDLLVAVVGPAAGTVLGCLLVFLVYQVDGNAPTTLTRAAVLGTCVATAIQVACMVPPAADGRVVVACLRQLRTGSA